MSTPIEQPTFNCPHCGGDIHYDGQSITQRCTYCGASVPVPQEFRPKATPSIQVIAPIDYSSPARRTSSTGCIVLIVGFVVFMVLITTVLPLMMAQQALNSIPTMPAVMSDLATTAANIKSEPTRRPPTAAPSPTPTPAFADMLLQFGEEGTGPGQFNDARSIGVDGEGRIYVGEYGGNRIQVFDPTGKQLNQFFAGDENSILLGFTVARDGTVYVADGSNITRYNGLTGKKLGTLKYDGGPGFGELALAPDGSLYAMWYQRRNGIFTSVEGAREDLVHFDAAGKVINVVKGVISSMTDSVELENSLAIDGRGNLFIAANMEGIIFKFDASGKFITRLGSGTSGGGGMSSGAIAIDGQGRLYVASDQVRVYAPNGTLLGSIDEKYSLDAIAIGPKDRLYATDRNQVYEYQIKTK